MGIGDFLKKQADEKVGKENAERNFAKNVQDLSIPFERQLNLNPEGRDLEWMDAVDFYESVYAKIRQDYSQGLSFLSGNKAVIGH